jgi:hypothetical protein
MILETLRAWTDWQQNATYGVNALLAAVPRDAGDPVPGNVATFVDETRNGPAARRRIPDVVPALVTRLHLTGALDPSVGPNVAHRDAEVAVATWYADRNVATENGNRSCLYVLRALQRSLAKFVDPSIAAANTARTRNGITIYNVTALQHVTTFDTIEDTDILGALFVTFKVRDTAP